MLERYQALSSDFFAMNILNCSKSLGYNKIPYPPDSLIFLRLTNCNSDGSPFGALTSTPRKHPEALGNKIIKIRSERAWQQKRKQMQRLKIPQK